jgi:hypothetical protein
MEINLKDIFRNSFGYEAPPAFSIQQAPRRVTKSLLGQQYYNNADDDFYGREFFLPVRLDDYLLPFAVMSMTWKKVFVTTHMPERGGSVHELISIDDYEFNIKGLLINETGNFPEQQIIHLHQVFSMNASIRLRSALSAIVLKKEELVIVKEVKWPATAGVESVKAFDINVESDQIFELTIK